MTVKKLLASLVMLIVLMSLAVQINVFGAKTFPDVPVTHLNYDAIMSLTEMGVVAGYEDGTFLPKKEITRTEFCALMARTLGYNKDTYKVKSVPFSDVSEGYWGRAFISFCYERGLINGMGDGRFAPADKVTVAQVVKMIVCAAGCEDEVKQVPSASWYSGYMKTAKLYGLLTENNQEPTENAFRSNAVQLVYNLIESGLVSGVEAPDVEEPETEEPPAEEDKKPEDKPEDKPPVKDEDDKKEDFDKTDPGDEEVEEEEVEEEPYDPVLEALKAEYAQKDFTDVQVIVIDAGHNYSGSDKGAQIEDLGLREEVINWEIADKLRKELKNMGYTVVMTREKLKDNVPSVTTGGSLQGRVDIAHDNRADLYISIHCNMGGGTGTETYCYSLGGYSARLAKLVQTNIVDSIEVRDRGVKTAGFYVIKNTLMPAILVECGFMDNEEDAEILTSEDGQKKIAKAIAKAVKKYDSMGPLVIEVTAEDED